MFDDILEAALRRLAMDDGMALIREAGVTARTIKRVLADREFRLVLQRVRARESEPRRRVESDLTLLACPPGAVERLARRGFGMTDADLAKVEADVTFQAELAVARYRGAVSKSDEHAVEEYRRQVARWIPGLLERIAEPDTPSTPLLKRRAHHQEILAKCLITLGVA